MLTNAEMRRDRSITVSATERYVIQKGQVAIVRISVLFQTSSLRIQTDNDEPIQNLSSTHHDS